MKLIILDRDGVINEDSDDYIKSPDEWKPIPGSLDAISRLNHAGYHVAVATNQSGIARGYFDLETLSEMHNKMNELLSQSGGQVDAVFFCPHGPKDGCDCRKPMPGLLEEISVRFQTKLHDVLFVGDTISDIKAAKAAGATPVIVKTGKGKRTIEKLAENGFEGTPVYEDLSDVVNTLLNGAS
mgnify:FL=1|jgi:D-glycero-D-manno-heptose 1,7-bisphosphate phosphatase